ncbi:MAG: polysaccharide pyruvyl transferase family protein [Desulfoprunum sp.]|nr:polysaccharide pyruvyl transferase family protein [Desulfoprunum sp.]
MINSVCLLGSAGGRNAGDAALISGIMGAIDLRLQRKLLYRIPTPFPQFVKKTYLDNQVEAINIMPWTGSLKLFGLPTLKAIKQSDLSLVFDAVLFDRSLYNPMFNFLSSLSFLLPAAKKAGRKVGLFNCGIGPITTKMGEKMLKRVCDSCDFITIREAGSAEILKRIGVSEDRYIVTADAALNAPAVGEEELARIFREIGLDPRQDILAINVNKYLDTWTNHGKAKLDVKAFLDILAGAIDQLNLSVQPPILLVSTYHGDIPITMELQKRLRVPQKVVVVDNKRYDHYQIKGILSKVSLLFAMRLHALILASSTGTPIAGLVYKPKVKHYFEQLGIVEACTTFADFNSEHLSQFLLENWNNRHATREILAREIPLLQKKAMIAADCVAELDALTT